MTLKTELSKEKHQWTLSLIGFVTANTTSLMWFAESSQALLKQLVEAGVNSLIIDLHRTEAIDSQGLRILIDAHMEFSAKNVQITLRRPNTHLSRLFRIMQLDRLFVVDSPDLT
jgi:anti-anti-sigma factor